MKTTDLEEFLGAVLRGAAKILGCGSTHLILINEKTQKIHVRLGAMADSYPVVAELERLLGSSFKGISFPIHDAQDSLAYQSWRDRTICETSSVREMVGSALPGVVVGPLEHLIGERRLICVPASSGARNYGVLLFEKKGRHPFSRQQRQLLLRYARRIGEILENDMMGQGELLFARLPGNGSDHLLIDARGRVVGRSREGSLGSPQLLEEIGRRARALLEAAPGSSPPSCGPLDGEIEAELVPLQLDGAAEPVALCTLHGRASREASLENQLLQLTLGEAAPALFVDTDFRITSCNDATAQLVGYGPSELIAQSVGKLFADPSVIAGILGQQIIDPANPYCEESAIMVCKDGTVCPVHVEALLLADDRDQAVGFLVLLREGTEAAREAAGRLASQERLAMMGEMAAQLAHEIRNPLLAIGATLETLGRDEAATGEQRATLASLTREIVRLDMLLKDYLATPHELSFSAVDVARAVDDARRLLEGAHRLAGKRIRPVLPEGLTVRADANALNHVFFNLLLNALEASPPDTEVTCSAVTGAHDVSIFIEDRGPGLGASATECFRPFFTTKKNGSGLGLAVCQKIARAHGGLVDLRNRDGGGCQAVLVLPRRS